MLNTQQLKELLRDERLCARLKFSEKEMMVLQMLSQRYKLQEIGDRYGVSRQRVHQVYCNAMGKIYKQGIKALRESTVRG